MTNRFKFLSAGLLAFFLVTFFLVTVARAEAGEASKRGFLGLQYSYEETTGSSPEGRFRVTDLYPGSPAEMAGLQTDDLIVAVNGVTFRFDDVLDIYNAFSWIEPGAEIELSILRDGSPLTLSMVSGTEPAAFARARPEAERQRRIYRARLTLDRIAEGDGVEITIIREGDGFSGEIEGGGSEGLDSEIEQEVVAFVASRYLSPVESKLQEGDRIKMFYKSRPPVPGAEPDAPRGAPTIRILESPPDIWKKASEEDGSTKKKTSETSENGL